MTQTSLKKKKGKETFRHQIWVNEMSRTEDFQWSHLYLSPPPCLPLSLFLPGSVPRVFAAGSGQRTHTETHTSVLKGMSRGGRSKERGEGGRGGVGRPVLNLSVGGVSVKNWPRCLSPRPTVQKWSWCQREHGRRCRTRSARAGNSGRWDKVVPSQRYTTDSRTSRRRHLRRWRQRIVPVLTLRCCILKGSWRKFDKLIL